MGMFTTEGCFIFMAFLQIFYQRGACQCSDGKIVESTAGYSPGSLFFRPYYFSIQGEECELSFVPAESSKSILIQLKLNHMVCGVTELIYTFSETPGEHTLCTNDTETFDIIVASPGETITVKINTRQTDYDYSTWLEAYLLASDDKSGDGCDNTETLTPVLTPQYVSSPNFPLYYTLNDGKMIIFDCNFYSRLGSDKKSCSCQIPLSAMSYRSCSRSLNKTCNWRIQINDSDYDIQIRVLFVDIRSGAPTCGRDYLQITSVETSANKFRMCDRGSFLKTALRVSNHGADVTFYDLRRPLHGFLIEYQLVNKTCTNPKADIAFLLDSSGSISTFNFRLMLSFVSLLISKYDLGDPSLQTSVVSFSTNAIVHFDLNDFTSTYDALSFISGISPMQQNTYTDRGIRIIREQVFNSSLGDREENPNILVIFTDGVSTEPNKTLNEINKIKENGVKVIAIGIQGFDEKEINLLASNDRYALKIEKFSDLQKLQNMLQELICLATEESVKLTTQTSTKLTSTSVEKGELTSTSLMSTTTLETISMKTTTDMSTQISTLPETDLITTTPVDERSSSYGASTTEVTTSFEISSANIDTTTERSSSDSTEAVSEILSSTENIQTLSVPTDGDTIKSTSESTTEYVSETTKFSSDIPTYSTTIFYTTEAEGLTETQTSRDMQSSTSTSATSNKMVSSDSTETSPIPASSTEQNDHRKSTKSTQDLPSSVGEFSSTTETLTSTAADSTTTEDLTTFGESGSTVDTKNYETTTTSQDLTSDSTTEQSTFHTEGVTSTVYSDKMTIPFSSSQQDLAIYTTVSDSSTDVSTTEITVEHFSSFSSVSTLPSLSETTTLKEEISSGSFSSNSTVISEIPMTTDSQNIQSSGTSTDSTLFETTTKAKTIIESTTEIITETTHSSTFASTHPTSMLHTTFNETKGLTETQTSHYAQTYSPIISDGTTDSHSPPTIEVSQGLGSSSVQVVTTSPTEMTTNKKHVSTDNDQTSKSSTSDSILGITTLPTINPTTTRDSSSEGLDNVIGTTVQFSTSTSNSVQETDALSVETTKMMTTYQKDTSVTGSISNSQPSTTTSGPSSTSTHSVMSMNSSLGTEKSTISPTQSSTSTPISTKSSFHTSSTTNTFQTGDGTQTKNISVFHTTENVAIRAAPSEDGGGLSLVAIWGITVTGITLVLGISSCCGCCYLIGGYRRKKRKRKRKKRYEKQDWHRLFDDFDSTLSINFRNGHFPTRMDSKLSHSFNSKRNRSGYLNDMYPYEDLNV